MAILSNVATHFFFLPSFDELFNFYLSEIMWQKLYNFYGWRDNTRVQLSNVSLHEHEKDSRMQIFIWAYNNKKLIQINRFFRDFFKKSTQFLNIKSFSSSWRLYIAQYIFLYFTYLIFFLFNTNIWLVSTYMFYKLLRKILEFFSLEPDALFFFDQWSLNQISGFQTWHPSV